MNICEMSELSKSYEIANDTKLEEQLEESSSVQDDYNKLKQENECYRQELYMLRLKLEASNALEKELQEINESLEQSLAQCTVKAQDMFSEKEKRYKIKNEEYENHIAELEMDIVAKKRENVELHEELRKSKDYMNKYLNCTASVEDTSSIQYKEKIEELIQLLQNEEDKKIILEEKLTDMENQYQEIKDILQMTKEELIEKNEALQRTREELAMNRLELESLKIVPANDICKGNSLFAEVEDRRQMLLGKMKALQCKYNETKKMINAKTTEIDLLRAEKAAMVKKLETDVIDTMQEKSDLMDKYKCRIVDLETKLKAEMKSNRQMEEIEFKDNFSYAQSLLTMKKKELKQLNEKIEQQAMQMLMQEEQNHNISMQLRFWQTKAMSMKAHILSLKSQLQTEQTKDDDKNFLETMENYKMIDITDFEKTCDNLRITSDNFTSLKNHMSQENSMKVSEKPIAQTYANKQIQSDGKAHVVAENNCTTKTAKQSLTNQSNQYTYPIISITDKL